MANDERTNFLTNPSTWAVILTALSSFGLYNFTPEDISGLSATLAGLVGTVATLLLLFNKK